MDETIWFAYRGVGNNNKAGTTPAEWQAMMWQPKLSLTSGVSNFSLENYAHIYMYTIFIEQNFRSSEDTTSQWNFCPMEFLLTNGNSALVRTHY